MGKGGVLASRVARSGKGRIGDRRRQKAGVFASLRKNLGESCYSEPVRCHFECSEGSLHFAQDKLREESCAENTAFARFLVDCGSSEWQARCFFP